jgi:hypothetical protein
VCVRAQAMLLTHPRKQIRDTANYKPFRSANARVRGSCLCMLWDTVASADDGGSVVKKVLLVLLLLVGVAVLSCCC